jgi:hypothetical protein
MAILAAFERLAEQLSGNDQIEAINWPSFISFLE